MTRGHDQTTGLGRRLRCLYLSPHQTPPNNSSHSALPVCDEQYALTILIEARETKKEGREAAKSDGRAAPVVSASHRDGKRALPSKRKAILPCPPSPASGTPYPPPRALPRIRTRT